MIVDRLDDTGLVETNKVVLNTPAIKAGQWRFAGIITPASDEPDAPVIAQPIRGAEEALGGWRASDAGSDGLPAAGANTRSKTTPARRPQQ